MQGLLVCDNSDESALLSLVVQRAGLNLLLATNLEKALAAWSERPADLVLVCLRRGTPAEIALRIRRVTETPVVVISNVLHEDVQFEAYESGADIVVSRPYSSRLLIAKLRALLRRSMGTRLLALPSMTVGELTLDPGARAVTVGARTPSRLTHLEFRLLYTLMIHRGQTIPTATLIELVWGYDGEGSGELVRGLVSRLRAKVEVSPREPKYIVTVPGVGYRLAESAD